MALSVRFGPFELDTNARELLSSAGRVRLQDQPFEILQILLEQPGHVVTRERMRERLWPAGTFVDFEHSLNAAVKRLRAALGDDADDPQFIETVPRRGYRFIGCLPGHEPPHAEPRVRVVVLPFHNLSTDRDRDYFADGLTEEMTAQLGRACGPQVGVIATQSAMHFKHSGLSVRAIGETLRADYVLDGSVRCEGERVRITARLVQTSTETQLWVDTYDRHLTDCLAVQSDVAEHIARSLSAELAPGPVSAVTPDPRAYQALLKGRYYWRKPGDSGMAQALDAYEHAAACDPSFAPAHAGIAKVHVFRAEWYHEVPRAALERARQFVRRALELDPHLADAHMSAGDLHRYLDRDPARARESYQRAMALNASHSAEVGFARLLASTGDFPRALREAERARELDPMCLAANTTAAWVRYLAGDYDTAVALCRDTLEMEEHYVSAQRLLGQALLASGRRNEALRSLERAVEVHGGDPVSLAQLAYARAATGDVEAASGLMATLTSLSGERYVSPYYQAMVLAALGDTASARNALCHAQSDCDTMVAYEHVDPRLASLRAQVAVRG